MAARDDAHKLATKLFRKFQGHGSAIEVAERLGVEPGQVRDWRYRGRIPSAAIESVRALLEGREVVKDAER